MTVRELMNKLKSFPEDCEVVTHIKVNDRKYIEVPCQEGEDWHVCGEEYQEFSSQPKE
jgi:hypothetical protein